MSFTKQYEDCYVTLDQEQLVIGNACIERRWSMDDVRPVAVSMINKKSGKEWLTTEENTQWRGTYEKKYVFYKQGVTEGKMSVLGIDAEVDDDCGIGAKHLRIAVKLSFDNATLVWVHIVYPGLPILRSYVEASLIEGAEIKEVPEEEARPINWPTDFYDCLPLLPEHCRWDTVAFYDRTDDNNNLVMENHGLYSRRESRNLQGNLLFTEDYMGHEGVLMVKEGPTPFAYLNGIDKDYEVRGLSIFVSGWGFGLEELGKMPSVTTYGSSVILWEGGKEQALKELHRYRRAVRVYVPERDAQIMSNTWGDGNADGRISETFLLNELERAAELGIDFYQIDDGWERGTTVNSVNAEAMRKKGKNIQGQNYYKSDPDFWAVNTDRLPNGLEPIMEYANAHNIRMGVWFSPDSVNDFENWQRDSDVIIGLHRKYGIKAFKMDGIFFRSKIGEDNFVRFARKVMTETKGAVLFNIDTTAGRRNGFFGRVQYGSLFLENRFTNNFGNWPNYWPHLTLRNLWTLSKYLTTEAIQIEFLNVNRNEHLYCGDSLAPAECGIEYAFAATMFATPLAWMELTNLNDEAVATLKKVIPVYRSVQADILSGFVQPIGEEPDGTQWTGMHSSKEDGTGYLQIFRELNDNGSHVYQIPGMENVTLKLESLLGAGKQEEVTFDAEGKAVFSLDAPLSYALYRYTKK